MEMLNSFSKNSRLNDIGLPVFFLGLYFIFFPLDFVPTRIGSVSKILAVLPIALTIAYRFKNLRVNVVCVGFMSAYLILGLISALYSKYPGDATDRTSTLLLNYAMIIVCGSIGANKNEKKFLINCMVLSGWFLFTLVLFFGRFTSAGRLVIFINGDRQDPNYFCGYLMFAMMYYLSRIIKKERMIASLFSFGIMLLVILLTGSRGGLLAVLFAGLCVVLFHGQSKRLFYKVAAIVALLLAVYLFSVYFLPQGIGARFHFTFTQTDGAAGRFKIWSDLIDIYKNDYGVLEKWFGRGVASVKHISSFGKVAHQLWLEALIELGRVGLILLLGIYLFFVKRAWHMRNKLFFCVLIGYIVMTFSLSLYAYKPIFALFIFINLFGEDNCQSPDGGGASSLEAEYVI